MKLQSTGDQSNCWQKEGVIGYDQASEQILDLSFRSTWNGCVTSYDLTENIDVLVCEGKRTYNSPQHLYMAVSNCRSRSGLVLKYHLEFFGYAAQPCKFADKIYCNT